MAVSKSPLQFSKEIVQFVASRIEQGKLPTPSEVAVLCGFSEQQLHMMNLFLDPVFNNGRIYLSPALVKAYFTDGNDDSNIRAFYHHMLFPNFKEGIDYFYLDPNIVADKELIDAMMADFPRPESTPLPDARGGAGKKFIAVSGFCYKRLIMMTKTLHGVEARDYFLALEALLMIYREVTNALNESILRKQMEDLIAQKNAMEEKLKARAEVIVPIIRGTKHYVRHEYIYIATDDAMEKHKIYKFGITEHSGDLEQRLAGYNGSRIESEQFGYKYRRLCMYPHTIESQIRKILGAYITNPPRGEVVQVPFDVLREVIDHLIDAEDASIKILESLEARRDTADDPPESHHETISAPFTILMDADDNECRIINLPVVVMDVAKVENKAVPAPVNNIVINNNIITKRYICELCGGGFTYRGFYIKHINDKICLRQKAAKEAAKKKKKWDRAEQWLIIFCFPAKIRLR